MPTLFAPEIENKKSYSFTVDTWNVGLLFYLIVFNLTDSHIFEEYEREVDVWEGPVKVTKNIQVIDKTKLSFCPQGGSKSISIQAMKFILDLVKYNKYERISPDKIVDT